MGLSGVDLEDAGQEGGQLTWGLSQRKSGQKTHLAKIESCNELNGQWRVVFDESIFFPGGGGQPADHGWVDGQKVLQVIDHRSVLLEQKPTQSSVSLTLDWEHRFDYMQQHTGQHLLSAIALKPLGWDTLSVHFSTISSYIHVSAASVQQADLNGLEERCNEAIRQSVDVVARPAMPDDLVSETLRCRKLPTKKPSQIRLVEIDGYDLNTCGGTHVSNTAQLQQLRIIGAEPHRGGTRLHFEVGGRLIRRLRRFDDVHRELNGLLTCGVDGYVDAVTRIQSEIKTQTQQLEGYVTANDKQFAETVKVKPVGRVVRLCVPFANMKRLSTMVMALTHRFESECEAVILFGASDNQAVFMMQGTEEWIASAGRGEMSTFAGRGGGRGTRLQGKIVDVECYDAYCREYGIGC